MKLIVAKFGGSSVADEKAMLKCADIVNKRPQIKLVVVSATYNTTNHLENIVRLSLAAENEALRALLESIRLRHLSIAKELHASNEVLEKVEELILELTRLAEGICLLKECSPKAMDQVYSIGERLSSVIMTKALETQTGRKVALVDAREVVKTDDLFGKARPDIDLLKTQVQSLWAPYLKDNTLILTQGFIGSTSDGHTTTLGREGSDFSATLMAEALDACAIQIWKDVTGIASTDPRLVENVRYIPELTYSEMSELSTLGAKVLHPFTLHPAIRKNIPVFVASTFEPDVVGTCIKASKESSPLVEAMTLRENQNLLTLTCHKRIKANEFFAKIFGLINKYNIDIDLVHTHESHLSCIISDKNPLPREFKNDVSSFCNVKLEEDLALVSLVGHGMCEKKGFMATLFKFFENFRVRQIHFGTGVHGLSFLVDQEKARIILKILHKAFIEQRFELKTSTIVRRRD